MAEEKRLKNSLSGIKGRITYYKNILSSGDAHTLTLGELKSMHDRLIPLFSKYEETQSELEMLSVDDDFNFEARQCFEKAYGEIDAKIINLIDDINDKRYANSTINPKSSSITTSESLNTDNTTVKIVQNPFPLPEMKLPEFDGDFHNWKDFNVIFNEMIHKNVQITHVVKFSYLHSSLKNGSAFHFIEGIPPSKENYNNVWAALIKHYENQARLKYSHMEQLYNLVPIKKENDARSLQMFIASFWKQYNALKSLNIPIDEWDLYLVCHISKLLDPTSRNLVEKQKIENGDKIPTIHDIMELLSQRASLLEAMAPSSHNKKDAKKQGDTFNKLKPTLVAASNNSKFEINCKYCKQSHSIFKCDVFNQLSWKARKDWVIKSNLCSNCFGPHFIKKCTARSCKLCGQKHHTLLHITNKSQINLDHQNSSSMYPKNEAPNSNVSEPNLINQKINEHSSSSSLFSSHSEIFNQNVALHSSGNNILLYTAIIYVIDDTNKRIPCRVLIDSASHSNFITERFSRSLSVKRKAVRHAVSGINQQVNHIKSSVTLRIQSRTSSYETHQEFLVIPRITGNIPIQPIRIDLSKLPSPSNLGDPKFYCPSEIDMLLGAEIYDEIMLCNKIQFVPELPSFRESVFGLIICGKVQSKASLESVSLVCCDANTLRDEIIKFWQLEELENPNSLSLEEKACEDHYSNHVSRDSSGRYVVSLPLKFNANVLGDSSKSALSQFYWMEKKLIRNPELYCEYKKFMQEYIALGHMSKVNESIIPNQQQYFMPHHAVLRNSSSTTKVRVVFNASSKTNSGLSLNDILMIGPTIQNDLFTTFVRFRTYRIALVADITKMYRQVLVNPNDRSLQQIYWRESTEEPVSTYQLNTVTYGTASAPFLVIRTLKQLAFDEVLKYPIAAPVLLENFYVDDLLTGATTPESASSLKVELEALLSAGGFELRKWLSNDKMIIPSNDESENTIILGIRWNHKQDCIQIQLPKGDKIQDRITKRTVLSVIAQFYDPIGICAPVIFSAKIFMQKLWTIPNLEWDDSIPENLLSEWYQFYNDLNQLRDIEIPRCISNMIQVIEYELHGFGDASELGYGSVIYIRTKNSNGIYNSQLLCARSKVAPSMKKHTIPRLELCAALLLSELYFKVKAALKHVEFSREVLWTDSEINLYRIKCHQPSKFPIFVSNRLLKIQDLTSQNQWFHIPSSLNPADLVSRGTLASQLLISELWWHGPPFLYDVNSPWPVSKFDLNTIKLMDDPEVRVENVSETLVTFTQSNNVFIERYSSYERVLRIASLCLRFIKNCKTSAVNKQTGHITVQDKQNALIGIMKFLQNQYFSKEIKSLIDKKSIHRQSPIKKLNPYIDENHVLRVGGRLFNSNVSPDQKNPIIVPDCSFARLIMQKIHLQNLHCGPQSLLSFTRQQFWVINGLNISKQIFRNCIRCFKMKPKSIDQLMGQLPETRVKPYRAFENVGVDYCGPFLVKGSKMSTKFSKTYIAIFICFATKAVHMEAIFDLSTTAFIAGFRRFVNRRGRCANLYSDNATNFVGAKSELFELQALFNSRLHKFQLEKFFAEESIQFHTIPPRSPHFGGLWEAAVKSAKHHLKGALGSHCCTHDEFVTYIVQIEGILNSRPLTPISSSPDDLTALTPAHFLIGGPINSLPEPTLLHYDFNKLARYQRLQFAMQQFWRRWSIEYLGQLQSRQKWNDTHDNVKIGTLILMKDENIPPMKWALGRIIDIHPGKDGCVRVVSINTKAGILKRAITKIAVLPIET